MNVLLSSLAKACGERKFTPKLLIVNSYRSGNQLLSALAREGIPWLNLSLITPHDLALEIKDNDTSEQKYEMVGPGQAYFLVSEILEEMNDSGRLNYFSRLSGNTCLVDLLRGTITELRMAGVLSKDLVPGNFVDQDKGLEIKTLLESYEGKLHNENLFDSAALYSRSLELLNQGKVPKKDAHYLIPEELDLNFLSFRFLNQLTEGQRTIIPAESVEGISRPHGFYFVPPEKPLATLCYSWLYEVEKAPPFSDNEPEIFQAYGAACEIKEVFRRLKKNQIPADQAVICYTSSQVYIPLLLTLSSTCGIPVTFSGGIPAAFTRPGKLFFGLLNWLEENYPVPVLYRLFTEGSLETSSKGTSLARLLRQAQIGWGRDRYLPCLKAVEQDLQVQIQKAQEEGRVARKDYLAGQKEIVIELENIITFILDRIPLPVNGEEISFQRLCSGLAEVIQTYSLKKNNLDAAAWESLQEQLIDVSQSLGENIPMGIAIKRLKEIFENLSIGASGFEPGHLHAVSLHQGEWFYRPHTYLVGLDDGRFPGSGLQDPILLERERAFFHPNLMDRSSLPEEKIYRLNRFLASRKGKITFSFPAFDPVEGRASFPSAALLQVYRLMTKDPQADYSKFMSSLAKPAAYFPEEPDVSFSEDEWWGSQVLKENKLGDMTRVRECYPGLHSGLLAEEARSGESFTVYDGKVVSHIDPVDPTKNKRPLSATSVERLAACPYSYFLRYILKINPPDEKIFDPGTWLDPLSRGLLLHQIYADYLRKIISRTSSSSSKPAPDQDLLTEISEELIEITREKIPPPSPVVYEQERLELLRELEVFLRAEEDLWQEGSIPVYLEVPFGFGSDEIAQAGQGLKDPVQLKLPGGGSIHLRGRIDRIDRISPKGVYRILDFKTGSTYNYDERKFLREGQQIQHALYGLAAEIILQQEDPDARVEETGYIFPTEKGEGQRFLHCRDRRPEALEALQKMLDLLSSGTFCPTDKQDRCTFCDYQPVCRFPYSVERMKDKLSSLNNTELEPWKELQNYD